MASKEGSVTSSMTPKKKQRAKIHMLVVHGCATVSGCAKRGVLESRAVHRYSIQKQRYACFLAHTHTHTLIADARPKKVTPIVVSNNTYPIILVVCKCMCITAEKGSNISGAGKCDGPCMPNGTNSGGSKME